MASILTANFRRDDEPEWIKQIRASLVEISKLQDVYDAQIFKAMVIIKNEKTDAATRSKLRAGMSKIQRDQRELDKAANHRVKLLQNYERDRK